MQRARHPKPAVEAALQDAEKHGWRVEPRPDHHGHAWGVIRCPEASPAGCQLFVNSTPRSPDNEAKRIRQWLDRCEHEAGDQRA